MLRLADELTLYLGNFIHDGLMKIQPSITKETVKIYIGQNDKTWNYVLDLENGYNKIRIYEHENYREYVILDTDVSFVVDNQNLRLVKH